MTYLRGLLAPLERKNGWHLAEAAGDRTPDAVHDFLGRARWDAEAVRDDLQAYVIERLLNQIPRKIPHKSKKSAPLFRNNSYNS